MQILKDLLDLIYPPSCPICKAFIRQDSLQTDSSSYLFCSACYADFQRITSPFCLICGRPFPNKTDDNHHCEDCLRKRPFYTILRAPFIYEGPLMKAIYGFKYGEKSYFANCLGPLMVSIAKEMIKTKEDVIIMPVPLHPKRLRERGFNQSQLLAKQVAGQTDIPIDFLSLRRIRYTFPQAGLHKDERKKNVYHAFSLRNQPGIKGKTILLIDDVATTRNTLNECARELLLSGAKSVLGLVLAIASLER